MKPTKRKQILEISEKLFNRFGIRRTGVDEIARMANVAKGTIYNYFGDKDGLFRALVGHKIKTFEELLEKSVASVKDPIEKLKIVASEHLKVIIDNPFLSDRMLYSNYEDKLKQLLGELEKKSRSILGKIVEKDFAKKLMPRERKTIVNTLVYTLKGMDESIRNRLEPINIAAFEAEIDYLVRALTGKIQAGNKTI